MGFLRRRPVDVPPSRPASSSPSQHSAAGSRPWAGASWLGWQTLTYSGSAQIKTAGVSHYEDALRAVVARHGRLVMAELRIEEAGEYAGAVRVYVGGVQLGSVPHGLAEDFRQVIGRLNAVGQPALCRAMLDAEPGAYVDVWLCGKASERVENDPFLPPTLGARLQLGPEVMRYLDDVVLGPRAKSKRVVGTGELLQERDRWRLVLGGRDLGPLPDSRYPRLDEARDAGFPLTCQVRVLRQPERPVRVEADFPSD